MHSNEQMAIGTGIWHSTYLAKREMITCDTSFKIKKDNLRDHPIPCHHYARSVDGSKDNPIKQSARTGNARTVFVPGKEHTRHQL